jgi:hypothetical protein
MPCKLPIGPWEVAHIGEIGEFLQADFAVMGRSRLHHWKKNISISMI